MENKQLKNAEGYRVSIKGHRTSEWDSESADHLQLVSTVRREPQSCHLSLTTGRLRDISIHISQHPPFVSRNSYVFERPDLGERGFWVSLIIRGSGIF
jgi:hypothetical protein